MHRRDKTAVTALRCALAAIDNAEAVDIAAGPRAQAGTIAGAVHGLGSGDVPRRTLTEEDIDAIVRAEIVDRIETAADYERRGQSDGSIRLRAEADTLNRLVNLD